MGSRGFINLGWGALSLAGAVYLSCTALGSGRGALRAEVYVPGAAGITEAGRIGQVPPLASPAASIASPTPPLANPNAGEAPAAAGSAQATETDAEPARTPAIPRKAYPGEALLLQTRSESRDVLWLLLTERGYRISFARGFRGTEPGHTLGMMALPVHAGPGSYRIEKLERFPDGSVRASTEALTVMERSFPLDVVRLDAANTAIRRDASPQRKKQIDRLNEILFRFDPEAPRFFGPWIPPVKLLRRSSEFGDRREYRYSDGRKETVVHWGIDYGIPRGTPVFASGDGLVALAENRISTGLTVVIEHLPGVYSLYYHLDTLTASEGESVRSGTLIGTSGSTGLSTGPHLHLEFRVNGEAVSPDWFFSLR